MDRSVKVKRLQSPSKGRTICISDIHGNLNIYKNLLNKVKYQPGIDRLMLLGDLVEKGEKNLETLHFVMNQAKHEDVHVIMGNCDFICKNVLFAYRLDFLKDVLLQRKQSLIHEMANQIGISLDINTDMSWYTHEIRKHFLDELCFCNDLPHVIDTDSHIYAHAAIMNETTFGDDFREVMTTHFFLNKNMHFHKKVIVGHLPVTEYCHSIASFDPIYDGSTNVYSIDGGNVVKKAGQLNALIFDKNIVNVESVDELPEVEVIETVLEHNQIPLFVTWNTSQIKVLKTTSKQSLVYNSFLNRTFWVENEFIQDFKATDYTNYQIPLTKGETVKLVCLYQDKAQVKKNGVLGWTYQKNLKI